NREREEGPRSTGRAPPGSSRSWQRRAACRHQPGPIGLPPVPEAVAARWRPGPHPMHGSALLEGVRQPYPPSFLWKEPGSCEARLLGARAGVATTESCGADSKRSRVSPTSDGGQRRRDPSLWGQIAAASRIAAQMPSGISGQNGSRLPARRLVTPQILLMRSEEHTSELQSRENLVCRLLLEKK